MSLPDALVAVPFGAGAALLALMLGAAMLAVTLLRIRARRVAGDASHAPVLRRADAHPDAPSRAPLRAMRDLGTPFLEVRAVTAEALPEALAPVPVSAPAPVERALPRDLSQALAAFDPGAIPDVPRAPSAKLPPLRPRPRVQAQPAVEGFELFKLVPPARPGRRADALREERITRPETEASVHALLDRLERGMIRHGLATGMESAPSPMRRSHTDRRRVENGLEHALATLRNLARSA